MSMLHDRRVSYGTKCCARLAGVAVLLSLLAVTEVANAQQFKQDELQVDVKTSKQMYRPVSQALRDPAAFQANKQILNDYFEKYYFPRMTLTAHLGQLEKGRESLFKTFIRPAKVPAAQQHLTNLTLSSMRVIAQGNYHPAIRYNAVLILGMLDEKVAGTGANATPPVPLPAGAKELLELLEKNEFNKVKVTASLKLGALIGLERHARFGINAEYANRLTKALLAVISQEESPADLDSDVHHWIQCQAARVLARQFAEGPNAEVQTALAGMIADANLSLEDRCCVAEVLGKIKYDAAAGVDVTATLGALGNLMKSVARDEAKKAGKFQKQMLQGNQVRRFGEAELIYQRRQLVARLEAILAGAKSLKSGLPEAEQVKLASLVSATDEVMDVAHDKDSEDLEITPKVIELERQVRSVVDSWNQAEEAPAEEAEADFS